MVFYVNLLYLNLYSKYDNEYYLINILRYQDIFNISQKLLLYSKLINPNSKYHYKKRLYVSKL